MDAEEKQGKKEWPTGGETQTPGVDQPGWREGRKERMGKKEKAEGRANRPAGRSAVDRQCQVCDLDGVSLGGDGGGELAKTRGLVLGCCGTGPTVSASVSAGAGGRGLGTVPRGLKSVRASPARRSRSLVSVPGRRAGRETGEEVVSRALPVGYRRDNAIFHLRSSVASFFSSVFSRPGGERRVSSRSRWCRRGKQRRKRVQVETIKRARGRRPCLRTRRPITGPLRGGGGGSPQRPQTGCRCAVVP